MNRVSKTLFSSGLGALVFLALVTRLYPSAVIQLDTSRGQDQFPYATVLPDSGLDSGWRMTEMGWQDSTTWVVDTFSPRPMLEQIHPLVWALSVLLLVLKATIWASNEWEIDRLFGNSGD